MSGQLLSQLKRDWGSYNLPVICSGATPHLYWEVLAFKVRRLERGGQEIEWQRGDRTHQGRGPQVRRNCSSGPRAPTFPTSRTQAWGSARRWNQPSGSPALTDALSGIEGFPVLLWESSGNVDMHCLPRGTVFYSKVCNFNSLPSLPNSKECSVIEGMLSIPYCVSCALPE